MATSNVVRLHTAAHTRVLPQHFKWELFDHPPYSPDLTQAATIRLHT
jgi:hypothetical protein